MRHRLLTVRFGDKYFEHHVPHGSNLRLALLKLGYTPYSSLTKRLNCGGRGLCATCGVWVADGDAPPKHWHDSAAYYFGYPRLSCQIQVETDMTVSLISDKLIWGKRDPQRARWRRRTKL